jgi:predicted transcriptional regulator
MANTPSGTVLAYTVDIIKDMISSNKVEADKLGELVTDLGNRLLNVKEREEGTAPVGTTAQQAAPAPAQTVKPVTTAIEATKPVEAPAAAPETAQQETPKLRAAEPQKTRGRKKDAQAAAKRKPGRPKGSGRKAAETEENEAVSEVLPAEVILPEADTSTETGNEAVAAEETVLEFNDPDPKAPNYKFKHLLDRFGVNPDGSAKRFNNMTEEETFDGEIVKSLFDGQTRKMLKRHLGTDYSMSVPEYITHFGLSKGYRPVGKDFSQSKSVDAKKTKLGHKADEPEQEAPPEQPIATPVKAVRRTRARAAQEA